MSPCYHITSIRMEQGCPDDWMSINPNKKGVADKKGMIQRNPRKKTKTMRNYWIRNPKKKGKKTMRNYWMSINPNKGPADRERMIQQHWPHPQYQPLDNIFLSDDLCYLYSGFCINHIFHHPGNKWQRNIVTEQCTSMDSTPNINHLIIFSCHQLVDYNY